MIRYYHDYDCLVCPYNSFLTIKLLVALLQLRSKHCWVLLTGCTWFDGQDLLCEDDSFAFVFKTRISHAIQRVTHVQFIGHHVKSGSKSLFFTHHFGIATLGKKHVAHANAANHARLERHQCVKTNIFSLEHMIQKDPQDSGGYMQREVVDLSSPQIISRTHTYSQVSNPIDINQHHQNKSNISTYVSINLQLFLFYKKQKNNNVTTRPSVAVFKCPGSGLKDAKS